MTTSPWLLTCDSACLTVPCLSVVSPPPQHLPPSTLIPTSAYQVTFSVHLPSSVSCYLPLSSSTPIIMPDKTKVHIDRIVAYNPDGSRETLGFRVESYQTKTKTKRAPAPFEPISVNRDGGHVPVGRRQRLPLPPIYDTRTDIKERHVSKSGSDTLPGLWKHERKITRYDYHQGMHQPSYTCEKVTHKVVYHRASPVSLDHRAFLTRRVFRL